MRYPADHKAGSRAEIVRSASRRFRADGIASVGVRSLMSDAGLTNGAFYSHFASRAELVAAAASDAGAETVGRLAEIAEKELPGDRLEAVVGSYLSTLHVEHMARGCAAAALAPEMAREDAQGREQFMENVRLLVDLLAGLLPPGGTGQDRSERSWAVFAGMMGSLQLARLAAPGAQVESILRAGRDAALMLAKRPWVVCDDPGSADLEGASP